MAAQLVERMAEVLGFGEDDAFLRLVSAHNECEKSVDGSNMSLDCELAHKVKLDWTATVSSLSGDQSS